jgi:predicted TIM-barrel fold metal-dependent hydrolase
MRQQLSSRFALIAAALALICSAVSAPAQTVSVEQLRAMPKIDAHAHIMKLTPDSLELLSSGLAKHNMKWLDICTYLTGEGDQEGYDQQVEAAARCHAAAPQWVSWTAGLSLARWGEPGWLESQLAAIRDAFSQGAVAVKVWKDIGMVLTDPDSSFVMIDDPRFDPVFDLIEREGKTLVAHIGEPRNCWLPLDSMTVEGDRGYYVEFPQYHCYNLPRIPDYWKQVESRDHVLDKHPNLRVVGCHLGSLEYDVGVLAGRLDKYPNLAVDMAGRIVHFQVQDREKVRAFILKYQDRLLYGTDNLVGWGSASVEAQLQKIERVYELDYRYFATAETLEISEVREGYTCQGLALPEEVLRKLYHDNAVRWYPGI